MGIYSQNGEKLVEYCYDAWGNMFRMNGDTELGNAEQYISLWNRLYEYK